MSRTETESEERRRVIWIRGTLVFLPFSLFSKHFFWSFIKLQLTVIRKRGRRCLRFGKAGVNVQS